MVVIQYDYNLIFEFYNFVEIYCKNCFKIRLAKRVEHIQRVLAERITQCFQSSDKIRPEMRRIIVAWVD